MLETQKLWENYINNNLIKLIGEKPEGNFYSKHLSNKKENAMIPKQINFINFLKKFNPKKVLEIGFNAGFSALLIKMICPDCHLTCIDINSHSYVVPCYNEISKTYPDIKLILENSLTALPKLIAKEKKFDVIHLDGSHELQTAEIDFLNTLKLCNSGGVIIFDDTNLPHLNNLCDKYIKQKKIKEYNLEKVKFDKYQNRFLEII